MHLLGTPVLVFLLLPLVLSCTSTKTKEEIIQNYQHIIQLQMENINLSIQRELKENLCVRKSREKKPACQSIQCISNASCVNLPKDINGNLQNELQKLVKVIGESLGCPCSRLQEGRWRNWNSLPSPKKYCKLKRFVAKIQNAYEQYNST